MDILEMTEEERWSSYLTTVWGYLYYNKSKVYEVVVKHLTTEFGDRYDKEIRCIVTNAARALKMNATGILLSRSRDDYTGNTQGISYRRMYSLIEEMKDKGYLSVNLGGVRICYGVVEEGYTSITRFSNKFISLFTGVSLNSIKTEVGDVVEVRDRETKEYKSTKGFRGIKAMSELVKRYNKKIQDSEITLDGMVIATQSYKRVFLDNLEYGGRWYNTCGGVQLLGEDKRSEIKIDGEMVLEYDYSAMHPNILYQIHLKETGEVLPNDFCPYTVEDLFNTYIPPKSERNLIKIMVMIGINAKSKQSAIGAVKKKVEKDKDGRFAGVPSDINYSKVYDKLIKHNHLISKSFFSDCGVTLQRIDSEILEYIIENSLDKGQLILPWHDGFVCKESYPIEDVLSLMGEAWSVVLGGSEYCKVGIVGINEHLGCMTFPHCDMLGYCVSL